MNLIINFLLGMQSAPALMHFYSHLRFYFYKDSNCFLNLKRGTVTTKTDTINLYNYF